ncbi:MAG: protoheme IX farnesyltransferase [Spirochaetia bacterium]|nr:protoheme IX farnesyltransferase [Spirochaetia bacterium]
MNTLRALYSLLKPGVAGAVLITVLPGFFLGTIPSFFIMAVTIVGTALCAMAAFAYNQVLEVDTDAQMNRTKDRVLPSSKLSKAFVMAFGAVILLAGQAMLLVYVNWIAAACALGSFLVYVILYTALLKRRTEHNTVIGGLSGAVGPLIGQAAAAGTIHVDGFLLFLLIFIWQPPHFWALAIHLRDDYGRAGFPMLPVVKGIDRTIKEMLIYQVILCVLIVIVYYPFHVAGLIYLLPSLAGGLFVLGFMVLYAKTRNETYPRKIFLTSIAHLVIWHAALVADFLNK